MAVCRIARMGHPVLAGRAAPVSDPADPGVRTLVADLLETLAEAQGAGLAAPQIHDPRRVVAYRVPALKAEAAEGGGVPVTVLVNPEVTVLDATPERATEACLSLPGLSGEVPRPRHIRVRAQALDGGTLDFEAADFHARVIQHEVDHLDGILYPMRMDDLSTFGFVEEMRRAARPADGTLETEG